MLSGQEKKHRVLPGIPMPDDTWRLRLKDHHDRMTKTRTTIPRDPPFQLTLRSPRSSGQHNPKSPRSARSTLMLKDEESARVAVAIEALPDEERSSCTSLVELLSRKSSEEARDILEAIYVATETKRLLQNYGGVYPALVAAKRPEEAPQQEEEL